MTHPEIVKKLIGSIQPIGKSEVDRERLNNLKELCNLIDHLVQDISDVAFINKHSHEHSVKEIANYAANFLDDLKNS